MFKKVLTIVILSMSCVNASENRIENQISYNVIPSKYTQNLEQQFKTEVEKTEQKSWLQGCWNYASNVAKGTLATLAMAYVVVPMAVDGLWNVALSEGTAGKCARSVLRFLKPSLNYITTNSINHFFKLI